MAPAHLPSELLSHIFLLLRDADRRTGVVDWHEDGFAADWIRVTWVCRAWRNAALQRRMLWTRFTTRYLVKHPDAIRAFLSRAPGAQPLHLTVKLERRRQTPNSQVIANAFEYLRPWAHRLELLSLWMENTESQVADINRFLGELGPALTTLAIKSTKNDRARPLNLDGLSGLQTLHLEWIPTGHNPLPRIRRIFVNEVFTARPGSLNEFLAVCSGVEELDITDALAPRIALHDPSEYPVVDLPQLRILRLHREPPDAAQFMLSTLRLPPTASFELSTILYKPSRTRELLSRDSWLRGSLPDDLDTIPVLSNTYSLAVRVDDGSTLHESDDNSPFHFKLYGKAGPEGKEEPHWSIEGAYSDGVPIIARYRYFGGFLLDLPRIVRPALLVRLELHLADWLPLRQESLWRELCGQLPALRYVVLGGWECIEAATRTFEAEPTLLPELEELSLCVSDKPKHAGAGRAMWRWLNARQGAGNGIWRLMVRFAFDARPEGVKMGFVESLLSDAQRVVPTLQIEVLEVEECLSCGWIVAMRQRARGPGAGQGDDRWEWDAPTDEEADEEEPESEDEDDDFWTSDSDAEDEDD